MTPQILQQLNGARAASLPDLTAIKNLMRTVRSAANPQAMLGEIMRQNPQAAQALSLVQRSGKNPRELFYALAKQRGADPDAIINALKSE